MSDIWDGRGPRAKITSHMEDMVPSPFKWRFHHRIILPLQVVEIILLMCALFVPWFYDNRIIHLSETEILDYRLYCKIDYSCWLNKDKIRSPDPSLRPSFHAAMFFTIASIITAFFSIACLIVEARIPWRVNIQPIMIIYRGLRNLGYKKG
jgi:hypothetical protein